MPIFPTIKRLIIIAILVFFMYKLYIFLEPKPENAVSINATTITKKIEAIGKLELSKFHLQQVVEYTMERGTFLPNARVILIVEGQAVGCIDLKKIKEENIRILTNEIHIKLPPAQICYFGINHQKSKVYDTDFELMDGSKLTQEAYKQAETQLYKAALQDGILEQTRLNAQKVLRPLFEQVSGGKKIVFEYELQPAD